LNLSDLDDRFVISSSDKEENSPSEDESAFLNKLNFERFLFVDAEI